MGRARRDYARCSRTGDRRSQDDGTTHDPTRRPQGTAGLQGCTLGHQGRRRGDVCCPEATARTGNTKSHAADVRFSMRSEDAYYDSQPLGHKKMESTVRYLGIEVDDALAIAEQVEV